MARPKTKEDLNEAAINNFEILWQVINEMPEKALNTDFDFSNDPKKKEAHWSRDKNLRDILIHLYEWHQLLLRWIELNIAGEHSTFLPEPYNWKTYGAMNIEFWKKHQNTSLEDAKRKINISHKKALELIQTLFYRRAFYQTIL